MAESAAADNADKLPSKSLLCVCAPYSLTALPSSLPIIVDPPLSAVSSWLLAGNAFAEVILSLERREGSGGRTDRRAIERGERERERERECCVVCEAPLANC